MKHISFFLLLFLSFAALSQNPILIDGKMDEWNMSPILHLDEANDGGFSGIDFRELQMSNDMDYLFFRIEVGDDINLQDDNDISIYLDTDNNSNTGFAFSGIGAELVYNFGNRSGLFYKSNNSSQIFHDDIDLVSAPTVSSDVFEIAIKRDITISGTPLFTNNTIKVIFRDNNSSGDMLPSGNGGLSYSFTSVSTSPLPSYSIRKLQESDLRIISYNALFDGLFEQDRRPSFSRIFQATQPDIIGFQEIYDNSSAAVAAQIEQMLPSGPGEQWYHAMEGPDCHVISKYPILSSAFIPGYNQNAGNGAFLLDIPDLETNLLIIVAHPPCCSNDAGRQTEVDFIMEFLREAKNGTGSIQLEFNTPIVILGDMNFVGSPKQLNTLLTGNIEDESSHGPDFNPDWNGADLVDSHPYATGAPFSFTWYDEGSSFSPGRLDYMIYSGSNMKLTNSYCLFTRGLSQDSLVEYNLSFNDAIIASDHLPIIADFELNYVTSTSASNSNTERNIQGIYPNPAQDIVEVSFKLDEAGMLRFTLNDQNGIETNIAAFENFSAGEHKLQLDVSSTASGTYFLKMIGSDFTEVKKIIIVKK